MAFTSDRRLYLSQDRSKVVEEGDRAAAWLFAPCGGEIAETEAERFGLELRDGRVVLPGPKRPAPEPKPVPTEPKSSPLDEDKAVKKSEDKAAKKSEDKTSFQTGKARE